MANFRKTFPRTFAVWAVVCFAGMSVFVASGQTTVDTTQVTPAIISDNSTSIPTNETSTMNTNETTTMNANETSTAVSNETSTVSPSEDTSTTSNPNVTQPMTSPMTSPVTQSPVKGGSSKKFDVASFFGGAATGVGLVLIVFVAIQIYCRKRKTGSNNLY